MEPKVAVVRNRGGCIDTYSGIKFYPLDPRPEDVSLVDIAHALSMTCRFNGHGKFFYSVAQHSLSVCDELRRRGFSLKHQLIGLLHDASEAYMSDMVTPVKSILPEYKSLESTVQDAIWAAFGLEVTPDDYAVVKQIDTLFLYWEANALGVDVEGAKKVKTRPNIRIGFDPMNMVEDAFCHWGKKLLEEYKKGA